MIRSIAISVLVALEEKFPNDEDLGREFRKFLKNMIGK